VAEDIHLDDLDRRLLEQVQENFPLVPRPFQVLGAMLGVGEDEAIQRVDRLMKVGIIRRIGPVLDLKRFGCRGVLVALSVPSDRIDEVAEVVNLYEEISHNYLRSNPSDYNMWFTISASKERIEKMLGEIEAKTGLVALVLPTIQVFKIGVKFEIPGGVSEDF